MCLLIDRFPPAYLFSSFFLSVRSVSQSHFSQFAINKALFFLHPWSMSYRINFSLQDRLKDLPQFNNVFLTECFDDHKIILFSECSNRWTESTFSAGGFKYNRSAKCSPRRRSRRLQRNRKSLRPCSQAGRVTLVVG